MHTVNYSRFPGIQQKSLKINRRYSKKRGLSLTTIGLAWVKAHAGTYGNELADPLAKQAARNVGINIPKSAIAKQVEEEGLLQ